MKNRNYMLMLPILAISAKAQSQNSVNITIEKVKKDTGKIYISMINKTNDFKKSGIINADAKDHNIVFENVPTGTYSVQVCQDVNSNGALDKVMGIPKEPVGFSQNPTLLFGTPSFEASAFEVSATTVKNISIKLKSIF